MSGALPEDIGAAELYDPRIDSSGFHPNPHQPRQYHLLNLEEYYLPQALGTPSCLLQQPTVLPPDSRAQLTSTHPPAQLVPAQNTRVARFLETWRIDTVTDRERERFIAEALHADRPGLFPPPDSIRALIGLDDFLDEQTEDDDDDDGSDFTRSDTSSGPPSPVRPPDGPLPWAQFQIEEDPELRWHIPRNLVPQPAVDFGGILDRPDDADEAQQRLEEQAIVEIANLLAHVIGNADTGDEEDDDDEISASPSPVDFGGILNRPDHVQYSYCLFAEYTGAARTRSRDFLATVEEEEEEEEAEAVQPDYDSRGPNTH